MYETKKELKAQGFTRKRLPIKDFKRIYTRRNDVKKFRDRIYIFDNGEKIIIRQQITILIKILLIFSFPFFLLLHGLSNIKEIIEDYKGFIFTEKHKGYREDVENRKETKEKIRKALK